MKHLTIAILFLLSNQVCGQDLDSLRNEIRLLKFDQETIALNLERHQDQYSLGTGLMLAGIGLALADIGIRKEDGRSKYTFSIIAAASIITGTVFQIDSHKWIGRAGRKRRR